VVINTGEYVKGVWTIKFRDCHFDYYAQPVLICLNQADPLAKELCRGLASLLAQKQVSLLRAKSRFRAARQAVNPLSIRDPLRDQV
jgi:hypothetical protein